VWPLKGKDLDSDPDFIHTGHLLRRFKMQYTRITRSWLLAMALATALSLGQTAWSHNPEASDSGCSVASLNGVYAIQGSAFFVPPGSSLPFMLGDTIPVKFQNISAFNGDGTMTTSRGVDTVGGLPPEYDVPTVGTYTVDADCTGELSLQTDHTPEIGGPHEHHAFITIVNNKKFLFTFVDPGETGSGFGERIQGPE
jgi:hypothetical protein